MFGVPGVRVLAAQREPHGLDLTVETDQVLAYFDTNRLSKPGPPRRRVGGAAVKSRGVVFDG